MWCIKDSGGVFCVFFTYLLFGGVSTAVVKVSVMPLASENALNLVATLVSYYGFICLAILCHLKCMATDPGAIPKIFVPGLPQCPKCIGPKPYRVHHCSTCNRCILKMDHHCPWMNNCIGFYNQKHFVLFLSYSLISCLYSVGLLVGRVIYCQVKGNTGICDVPVEENSVNIMLGLMSIMLLVLFILFIVIMLFDQIACIANNTTGIENLKQEVIERRDKMVNFSETFGGEIGLKWLLPFAVPGGVEEYLNKFNKV